MPWNGNSYKHVTLLKHHIFSGVILKDKSFSSGAVCLITIVEWSEWFVYHWADTLCTTTFFKGWITENFVSDSSWCGVLWFWWVFFDDKSWANHYFWFYFLFQDIWCYLAGLWTQHGSLFFFFPVFHSCRFLLEEVLRFSLPEWDSPGPKLCQPFVIVLKCVEQQLCCYILILTALLVKQFRWIRKAKVKMCFKT